MTPLSTAAGPELRLEGEPETVLAEQLVEFANAAYVLANAAKASDAAQAKVPHALTPALRESEFSDVWAPALSSLHLKHTRVTPNRQEMLLSLPRGGVCMEIGAARGGFGCHVLSSLEPAKLHLCDYDFNSFDTGPFESAIEAGIVELHEGEAADHLAAQADGALDLICIHAGHSYMSTARTLEQAGRKLKEDGHIVCANYTTFSPLEGIKCGVARAVNEFCHTNCFEISHLALHSLGCQDAALRKSAQLADPEYLGGSCLEAPDANTFLPDIWEHLITKYQIRSVLDVGAGAGWSTKWFAERGMYTLGVEAWRQALDKNQCRPNIVEHDYTTGPFIPSMILDLAWCAGFVEKIEERFLPNFIASFRACRHVCLTHAEPGQQGFHHVNCQPTDYWIQKMQDAGFDYDPAETAYLRSTDKHKAPWGRRTLTFFTKRQQP